MSDTYAEARTVYFSCKALFNNDPLLFHIVFCLKNSEAHLSDLEIAVCGRESHHERLL